MKKHRKAFILGAAVAALAALVPAVLLKARGNH